MIVKLDVHEEMMKPFRAQRELLISIPGSSPTLSAIGGRIDLITQPNRRDPKQRGTP
jgi:hypothetical protein